MQNKSVYNSKNIFFLVFIFVIIFILLYQLISFFHEGRKINREIELIRQENEKIIRETQEKKEYLEYLKTAERIDKEAKMQMGKKLPNEHVLVFVEENLDIFPTAEKSPKERFVDVSVTEKWKWLFFGKR